MIELLKQKMTTYNRELGRIESLIETEKISNPAHHYNKRKIELEALISLSEELYIEALKSLK